MACASGRDGRLYIFTDRGAPRGRLMVDRPGRAGLAAWRELHRRRTPRRCSTATPSWTAPNWTGRCCWRPGPGTRSARSPCTTWPPASGWASIPLPGLGTVGGLTRAAAKAGTRPGSAIPTTPRRPRCYRYDARNGAGRAWRQRAPGVGRRCPTVQHAAGRLPVGGRHDRADADHRPGGSSAASPRPAILYGYGGFGISLTPGLLADDRWPGPRRAASTRSPGCAAAARRARTGTAPACATTSRTSSTTSTPPPRG